MAQLRSVLRRYPFHVLAQILNPNSRKDRLAIQLLITCDSASELDPPQGTAIYHCLLGTETMWETQLPLLMTVGSGMPSSIIVGPVPLSPFPPNMLWDAQSPRSCTLSSSKVSTR
jgi:hypothetical protein